MMLSNRSPSDECIKARYYRPWSAPAARVTASRQDTAKKDLMTTSPGWTFRSPEEVSRNSYALARAI